MSRYAAVRPGPIAVTPRMNTHLGVSVKDRNVWLITGCDGGGVVLVSDSSSF